MYSLLNQALFLVMSYVGIFHTILKLVLALITKLLLKYDQIILLYSYWLVKL